MDPDVPGRRRLRVGHCTTALFALCALLGIAAAWSPWAGTRSPDGRATGVHVADARHASLGLQALPVAAQGPISAKLGAADPHYRVDDRGSTLRAKSPAENLAASFARSGVTVRSHAASVGLTLRTAGYGSALHTVAPVGPTARANRVTYAHPGVTESYENGPLGLEQSFEIPKPGAASGAGPLTLSLALSGASAIALGADRRTLAIGRAGQPGLIYRGLSAVDARGRTLRSWLQLDGRALEIRIDAHAAVYPVRIDPFFQQGSKLTADDETGTGGFGSSVALSADGSTAVIGGDADDGGAGAAWVFTRSGGAWSQHGPKLTASDETGTGGFGSTVAVSSNGNTALIGGDSDNGGAGAAWVFTQSGGVWSQSGSKLTASDETGTGAFGSSVALAPDGAAALIGADADNGGAGAAWVFTQSGGVWSQSGSKLTPSDETGTGAFGSSAALASDGSTALIGADADNGGAGAAWVFTLTGGSWSQRGPKLVPYDETGDGAFGSSAALASDGNTALIAGDADNGGAGAAWEFTQSAGGWSQDGTKLTGAGESGSGGLGASVALSSDGSTALAGGNTDSGNVGAAWEFANWSTPPTISSPMNGTQLTATSGTFVGSVPPVSDSYKWQRCDATGTNCSDVVNATGPTYTPTSDDSGHKVTVVETAVDSGGSKATATADPVNPFDSSFSATQSIAIPPASNFAGSAGGDGWAVALSSTEVFNVFHHQDSLEVACHEQADGSPCPWASNPALIQDESGRNFASDGHPGMYLDQKTGKLWVYATRDDGTGGVACIDTTQADTESDPFCGFKPLTAVGDAVDFGLSNLSSQMQVGTRLYSFNYVIDAAQGQSSSGSGHGAMNEVLCFDLSTHGACPGQPYAVNIMPPSENGQGQGIEDYGTFPEPATAAVGHDLMIPIVVDNNWEVACFDTTTLGTCAGSWPVDDPTTDAANFGAPFPMLDSAGTATGMCLPSPGDPCWDLDGTSVATPSGMSDVISQSSNWNGPAVTVGPRVYVPNGNTDQVSCFDYATDAGCPNFPHSFSNLELLYTVNRDPQRPTCLWVNADGGDEQIQDFDAYTGGGCGSDGTIRALASQFVVPTPACSPANYTSLQVISPAPGTYTSGEVSFEDGDGATILNSIPLDGSGTADLSGLNLNTSTGLPQFLITLNGEASAPASIQVQLNWQGTSDSSCQGQNVSVNGAPSYTTPPSISGTPKIGQTLTADPGDWSPSPSFTYQWYDCSPSPAGSDGSGCSPIFEATDPTYTLTSTDADSSIEVAVTATSNGSSSDPVASTVTDPVPGPASHVSVSLTPSQVTADGQSTSLATATVTDDAGTPVPGDDVTITSDGDQSVGPVSPGIDPGSYVATITSTTAAGTATITAQDLTSETQPSGTATLTQVPGPAAHVALDLSPSTVVADGSSQSVATATVTDADGNSISGDPVTIVSNDPDQAVTNVSPGNDPGTYVATITATTAIRTDQITATDLTDGVADTETLTQKPDAAIVSVALSSPSIAADGVSTTIATATVTDAFADPAIGDHVTFQTTGDQGIGPVTDHGDGTYSATVTSSTTAGRFTISAQDATGTQQPSGSTTLTQVAGAATQVGLVLSPASVVADGRSTSSATATVTDANGNPVSGDTVAFASDGVQLVGTTTDHGDGTYTTTVTSTSTAGQATITATDTSVSPNVSATALLTQSADKGDHVSVQLSPASITADGQSTSTATATVTDQNGNPVSGDTVTLGSSGSQQVGAVSAGVDPGTYVATVTSTTHAGVVAITATDTTAAGDPFGSALLTQTTGPATGVALVLSPSSLVADGHSTSTATATVTDQSGNPVSGDTVTISSAGSQLVGSVTDHGDGTYTATVTATTTPGQAMITATDTSVQSHPADSATLTQTADKGDHVSVQLTPSSIVADGQSTSVATATVTDQNDNPVSGDTITFGSSGAQQIGSTTDHGDGTYTATVTSSTLAGQSTITATDTSSSPHRSGTAQLAQTPGTATHLAVALSPASVVADGHATSTATVTVTDQNGNPVSGDSVTIVSDGAQQVGAVIPGPDQGSYQATITSTSTIGTATITGTDTSPSPHVSGTATLTQTAASGDHVALALAPATVIADGSSTTNATATITDPNGNPVTGATVAITSSGAQQIGPVSPGSAAGTYEATITSTTTAGQPTITATDTSDTGHPSGSRTLTQVAGRVAHVAVALQPASLRANGSDSSTALVVVTDANGNPISGDHVTVSTSGAQAIGPVAPGPAAGVYEAVVTASATPGVATITASDAGVSATTTLLETDVSAPAVVLAAPVGGAVYRQHQKITAAYSCVDPDGAGDVASCTGRVAPGSRIDTSKLGPHKFTVTTADRAGNASSVTVHYQVVPASSKSPFVYVAGPVSTDTTSIALPLGCSSPGPDCRSTIRLRMTVATLGTDGRRHVHFEHLGFLRDKIPAGTKRTVHIPLNNLGRQTATPGSPIPTIIVDTFAHGSARVMILDGGPASTT